MCFWKKKVKVRSTEQLAEVCKTPAKIVAWVHRNIWYKDDMKSQGVKDYWQTAAETLTLKTGDCEDFSCLIGEALSYIGVVSYILAVIPEDGFGHAVCVYEFQGKTYAASNWDTRVVDYQCPTQDIAEKVYKNWKTATIYSINTIVEGKNKPTKRIFRGVEL